MVDVQIIPDRLLSANTTEKLLREFYLVDGVERILLQGPLLSKNDPERRIINLDGEEVELKVMVGRIIVEVAEEEAIEKIKEICDYNIPHGFELYLGEFIRSKKTVTDSLKYGESTDKIPKELVGLTDPNARLKDRVTILKKKKGVDSR